MPRRTLTLAALAVAALLPAAARADDGSLYSGPAPRPGPDLLYAAPAEAPQLTNAGVWRADPILVSGATAYRGGEFLYQDFLYDDHGAQSGTRDPGDRRNGNDTFSQPNGSYTYPTDPAYANDAADLVELRVRALADATAFRLTLNSMTNPELVGATIAIGGTPGVPLPFPHGANATAPARFFLTVHGTSADLLDAVTKAPVPGGAPVVTVDRTRRQIEVRVPHAAWDPGRSTVRLAAGVGLWDAATGAYKIPRGAATATQPGGAGALPAPPAFFNVAFRTAEPLPQVTDPAATAASPAWWRDRAQGEALRTGDLSPFHADVDFGKLAAGTNDDAGVPRTGVLDRILASHTETEQGIDFSRICGTSAGCEGEYRGRLQPYALYVPPKAPAGGRYGLQLLLHSLGANYNQFSGSRNQSEFGDRGQGHLVMTAEGRGPDGWYYDRAGADTFEVWADVARRYPLDPALTSIAGYSMGGYATWKFATQFPDLFARAQPTVGPPGLGVWVPPSPPEPGGEQSLTFRQLASLRNIPVLMWNAVQDELVPYAGAQRQAQGLDDLGYRYELDSFSPAEHLTLAVHDQYAPAAAFLGDARVDRDPPHVTYVRNPTMDFPADGTSADHAYWLSGIALRDGSGGAPLGSADALSRGFGVADPAPGGTQQGAGSLPGGTFGAIPYVSQSKAWGPPSPGPRADALALTVRNLRAVTVHPERARLTCAAQLTLDTDGPVTVTFAGCGRTVTADRAGVSEHSGTPCAVASSFKRVTARGRGRGRGVRIAFTRRVRGGVQVDVLRHSAGRRILGARRVARFRNRTRTFTWRAQGAGDGYYTVVVRLGTDVRRLVLERIRGRFLRRPQSERRPGCGTVRAFRLSGPVFGGTRGTALRAAVRLAPGATGRVQLLRGTRLLRQQVVRRRAARFSARGLAPGTYHVRVDARSATGRIQRVTLTARRL